MHWFIKSTQVQNYRITLKTTRSTNGHKTEDWKDHHSLVKNLSCSGSLVQFCSKLSLKRSFIVHNMLIRETKIYCLQRRGQWGVQDSRAREPSMSWACLESVAYFISPWGCWHCPGWPYISKHAKISKSSSCLPRGLALQHHPVIKLQLEASNEGTHQWILQRNAKTESLVAGTELPTVEEVCLEDIFRSEKALVSIFIITKLLINFLDVQQYVNSVTWVVSLVSLLILFAL